MKIAVIVLSLWFAVVGQLLAHGDLHEQIKTVSMQIAADPKNAVLYHKRGELHRAHGEYKEALADYSEAEKLDSTLDVLFLSRGRALLESEQLPAALAALNTFLSRHPDHIDARWLRGRVFARLSLRNKAEADFQWVLANTSEPTPEQVIERSKNLEADGRRETAVACIEDGVKQLGSLITLEMAALDLELSLQRYKPAIDRLDRLINNAERKETFLIRKAEVLELSGDKQSARNCYAQALAAIDSLPEFQRKLKSTLKLEQDVQAHLSLNSKSQ